MKKPRIRRPLVVFAVCIIIATACFTLSFIIDRSGFAKRLGGEIISILTPFVIGGVVAFILKPLCNRLDGPIGDLFVNRIFKNRIANGRSTERKARRGAEVVSIAIAMLVFFGIIYALLAMVLPQLFDSVVMLITGIPGYLQAFSGWLLGFIGNDNPELTTKLEEFFNNFSTDISEFIQTSIQPYIDAILSGDSEALSPILNLVMGTIDVGKVVIGLVLDIIVSIAVSVYTLAGRKKFAQQGKLIIKSLFPKKTADMVLAEVKYVNHIFSRYVTGRMLDSMLVSVMVFIACSIVGIPQSILVSILVGFSNMIPFFGPYIGTIPSAIIILMIDPIKFIYFLILVIIIQQLDSNIFDPMVVGNAIDLSSFWVLFAVLLFGGLFGFPGLLLGVPTFAVLYDLVRKLINFGLKKRGEEDLLTEYTETFHPQNDADLPWHEKLRPQKRKRATVPAHEPEEDARISELVMEAQASGTTEAEFAEEAISDHDAHGVTIPIPLDARPADYALTETEEGDGETAGEESTV